MSQAEIEGVVGIVIVVLVAMGIYKYGFEKDFSDIITKYYWSDPKTITLSGSERIIKYNSMTGAHKVFDYHSYCSTGNVDGDPLNIRFWSYETPEKQTFNPYGYFSNPRRPTKIERQAFQMEFGYDYKLLKKQVIDILEG